MNTRDGERPPNAQSGESLAQVALVLGCISIVLFPVGLGGVLVGIVALKNHGPGLKSALAIALSVLTMAAGVSIVGGDVLRFKVRAKQAECKTHLALALESERAFLAKTGGYSSSPVALGFTLTTAPHSLLLFAGEGPIAARFDQVSANDVGLPGEMWHWEPTNAQLREQMPVALLKEVGVHGTCPSDCSVTLACVAQIDHDPTLDVWSASTRERRSGDTVIPAGELFNDVDDVWH